MAKLLRALGLTIPWCAVALLNLWAVAALWVDIRIAMLRIPVTVIYVVGILAIPLMVKGRVRALGLCLAGFATSGCCGLNLVAATAVGRSLPRMVFIAG